MSGARRDPVLRALRVLREEGVWLEVTNLVIPGWTEALQLMKVGDKWLVQRWDTIRTASTQPAGR